MRSVFFLAKNEHPSGYFDDLQFIAAGSDENYRHEMNRSFPGTCSVEFIAGGKMRCSIDSAPETVVDFPALFWHHPRFRYKYGPCDEKGWHHHWVLMRGERARRLVEDALMANFKSGFAPTSAPLEIHDCFHSLLQLLASHSTTRHPEAVALLETIVAKALFFKSESRAATPLDELFAHIKSAPEKDWDFQSLAKRLGVSYGHFRRLFKELSGRSPKDFVLHCRVARAVELLLSSDLRIKEVARRAGFADQTAFSKTFKARTGESPKACRNGED